MFCFTCLPLGKNTRVFKQPYFVRSIGVTVLGKVLHGMPSWLVGYTA
jgi:hypothetical protein